MSEVQVKLTLVDQVTAQAKKVLTGFKAGLDGVKFAGAAMMTTIDARAFSGVFKSVNKAAQLVGQLNAKFQELAPNAKQFTATFSEKEQANIDKTAESFNRLGASWDRFVGTVLAGFPGVSSTVDRVAQRLDQVSREDIRSPELKALEELKAAEAALGRIDPGQVANPNQYYKAMVDGLKATLALKREEYAAIRANNAELVRETILWRGYDAAMRQTANDDVFRNFVRGLSADLAEADAFLDATTWAEVTAAWELAGRAAAWEAAQIEKSNAALEEQDGRNRSTADSLRGIAAVLREVGRAEAEYWDDLWAEIEANEAAHKATAAATYETELDAMRRNMEQGVKELDAYFERIAEQNAEIARKIEEAAGIMTNNAMQFFDAIITGSENAGRAFTRMVAGMLSDFGRMMTQRALMSLFSGMFGGGASAESSDLNTNFGGNEEMFNLYGTSYDGPHAAGGSVRSGHPIMVGERGPEMFVPSSSGNIVTSGRSGGGGGIGSVTINVNGAQDPGRTAREVKSALLGLLSNDPATRQRLRVVASAGGVA